MKAKEFIKKFGWGEAKKTATKYTHIDGLSIPELKEYVTAWGLVQIHGLDQSKIIVNNTPSDEHFYSWTLGNSGVRDKSVNVGELRKAIQLVESIMCELWAVNTPEEPDSVLLYPVPTQEIGEQLVSRLKEEALKQFPDFGQCIADFIYLEKWDGSEEDHAKYLRENKDWWIGTTFLDDEVA